MKQKSKVVALTAKEEAKKSYSREEVEALCREAFSKGWEACLDESGFIRNYASKENEFINNNLK